MNFSIARRLRPVLAASLVAAVTFVASNAAAQPALMEELPTGYDTVVTADFQQLRGSALYEEALSVVQQHPQASRAIADVDDQFGIDLRSDLHAMAMVSESPPLSSRMFGDLSGAVERAAANADDNGSIIFLQGDFDSRQLMRGIGEIDDGEELPSHIEHRGVELHAIGADMLAVINGPSQFVDTARQQLAGDRSGPGDRFQRAARQIGNSPALTLMMAPSVEDPEAVRDEVGTTASFVAAGADVRSGLQLALLAELDGEDAASELVDDIDEIRGEIGENPLVDLLGFGPLVANLSVQQSGAEVIVRSSMTDAEARRLAGQLRSISEQSQQLESPIEGDRLQAPDSGDDADADDVDDGVDADFN